MGKRANDDICHWFDEFDETEDYVPPQGEKQIAPKPPKYPKY